MSLLGPAVEPEGTRFLLTSRHATAVHLCLFDEPGSAREVERIPLRRRGEEEWDVLVRGVGSGQLYGYRVDGPFRPQAGHRFNPAKLLVDPRAGAVTGEPTLHSSLFGFVPGAARADLSYNGEDSASFVPKGVVVEPPTDATEAERPRVPWADTLVYECHVEGMTRLHPDVPPELRGTYPGLAHPAVLEHLRSLGVTTLELLPVHQIASEPHLGRRGLRNHWGYSTLAYFAPHAGYATGSRGEQVDDFRAMVRDLHRAGFEVLLDVVYNHTAEGGADGPTLSLRGVDNRSYYRLDPRNRRRYRDWADCGNTLDLGPGPGLELVMGSLRYWARTMGVDGFRFDLAPVLGRDEDGFRPEAPFFEAVAADPVLSRLKLVAEPWGGGYELGRFPEPWAEWNDRYRDALRRSVLGRGGAARELALRLAGSPDLFSHPRRSVDFVACHDGFTLRDLASYDRKHNERNGEGNRDGSDSEVSRAWGPEGATDDPEVRRRRDRARRSLVALLAVSRGVPMWSHGDELGRTQGGNNNAYARPADEPPEGDPAFPGWVDWTTDDDGARFLDFVRDAFALRRRHPVLRRRADLAFVHPDGRAVTDEDWSRGGPPAFALRIAPEDAPDDVRLVVAFNPTADPVRFVLPEIPRRWSLALASDPEGAEDVTVGPGAVRVWEASTAP